MTVFEEAAEAVRPSGVEPSRVRRGVRRMLVGVALADLLVLLAAVALAWDTRLTFDVWWATHLDASESLASTVGPYIVALWMLVLAAQGAYSTRNFGAGSDEFRTVFLASLITAGTVGMLCYLLQFSLSRGFVVLVFFLGTPLLLLERYTARKVLHQLRVNGRLQHRVVAVGGPDGISEVVAALNRERYVGYEVVAACVPAGIPVPRGFTVPVLGSVEQARSVCELVGADTVLVARGGYASSADLRRIAWDIEESDLDLVVVPSLTDVAGPRIHMRPVAGLPLLHVEGPQADEAGGWAKRVFDVVGAVVLLALLSPVLLAAALAVKLHDRGPVLFRQPRVGRDGRLFPMLKFRSMVTDAESRLADLAHLNESDGVLFKIRRDPRVTPVGRFLRKYSIDELPQLFNVLRGQMSLVGPRPPLAAEVAAYGADDHRRLLVRPGMTGLWQVSGRSELSWNEAVRLDLYYVDNWSMVTDLVIMAKTMRAVLASSGAY